MKNLTLKMSLILKNFRIIQRCMIWMLNILNILEITVNIIELSQMEIVWQIALQCIFLKMKNVLLK